VFGGTDESLVQAIGINLSLGYKTVMRKMQKEL